MDRDDQPRINANELERILAWQLGALAEITDDEQRSRHAGAIEQLFGYVALLRNATSTESCPDTSDAIPAGRSFSFKLELEDGRWDVEEKKLATAPRVGDVLSLGAGGAWRVRASQLVHPRPAGKPAREFFVCAPTA